MLPFPLVNLNLRSKYLKHNVLYGSILESTSAFLPILWEIPLKYIFKIIFIHKYEGYVMFGRLGMVLNVDFRDVQKLEPLPKFGFCNMFVTSKNPNFLFGLSFPRTNVRPTYNIPTVLHTF